MAKTGAYWDSTPLNFGDVIHAFVREKTRDSALKVFNFCVANSPIDSGAYRASWHVSEGSPEYNWVGKQPRNGNVLSPPPVPKLSTRFYRTFFVTNGAPYAERIEYGWSDQAPRGVMRQALKSIS